MAKGRRTYRRKINRSRRQKGGFCFLGMGTCPPKSVSPTTQPGQGFASDIKQDLKGVGEKISEMGKSASTAVGDMGSKIGHAFDKPIPTPSSYGEGVPTSQQYAAVQLPPQAAQTGGRRRRRTTKRRRGSRRRASRRY